MTFDNLTSWTRFEWPFVPALGLRCADVLQSEVELQEGAAAGAEAQPQSQAAGAADLLRLLTLTASQFDQLSGPKSHWKPSRLAWGERCAETLDGHYGVSVGQGNSQLVPRPPPHPPRRFSPVECARLMGFAAPCAAAATAAGATAGRSFVFPGRAAGYELVVQSEQGQGLGAAATQKALFKMFGNAVVPPLVAVLAGALISKCPALAQPALDWTAAGQAAAVRLALATAAPARQLQAADRLVAADVLAAPAAGWLPPPSGGSAPEPEPMGPIQAVGAVGAEPEPKPEKLRKLQNKSLFGCCGTRPSASPPLLPAPSPAPAPALVPVQQPPQPQPQLLTLTPELTLMPEPAPAPALESKVGSGSFALVWHDIDPSEKNPKLAQKLGHQLQPFIDVSAHECMGQLASFGPT